MKSHCKMVYSDQLKKSRGFCYLIDCFIRMPNAVIFIIFHISDSVNLCQSDSSPFWKTQLDQMNS